MGVFLNKKKETGIIRFPDGIASNINFRDLRSPFSRGGEFVYGNLTTTPIDIGTSFGRGGVIFFTIQDPATHSQTWVTTLGTQNGIIIRFASFGDANSATFTPAAQSVVVSPVGSAYTYVVAFDNNSRVSLATASGTASGTTKLSWMHIALR
jgi:hypothetical protein